MSLGLSFYDKLALSQLTSMEKQSLYQLLCAAMVVDGQRDSREMAIINEVKQLTGMTAADLEASRKLTEPAMTSCLRNMEVFKKMYVGKFIAQIVSSAILVNFGLFFFTNKIIVKTAAIANTK